MSWELEFRKIKDGTWRVFTRGSLEECLEDMLDLKAGQHGWGNTYDAARLGFVRGERPGEPVPPPLTPGKDKPSKAVMEGGLIRDVALPSYPEQILVDVRCHQCGEMHPVNAELTNQVMDNTLGATRLEYTGRMAFCPNTPVDINLVKLAAHQHVWHEDVAQALWVCVYEDVDCPARVTHDELDRAMAERGGAWAVTERVLDQTWEAKK